MSSPSIVTDQQIVNEQSRLVDPELGQLSGREVRRCKHCSPDLQSKICLVTGLITPLIGGGGIWLIGTSINSDSIEKLGQITMFMTALFEGIFGSVYLLSRYVFKPQRSG